MIAKIQFPESLIRCKSCKELVAEYERSTTAYSEAGKRLMDCIYGQEVDLYARLRKEFQALAEECQQKRHAVVEHFATHRVAFEP